MTATHGTTGDHRWVRFEVVGTPAPQGSKRHVGNGVMVEQVAAVKPWRTAVAAEARTLAEQLGRPLDGILYATFTFRFPMPASRPKAVRNAGEWPKTTAPDLDKLVRSTYDALTAAGLIRDDARIANLTARKVEVRDGWHGAVVMVQEMQA